MYHLGKFFLLFFLLFPWAHGGESENEVQPQTNQVEGKSDDMELKIYMVKLYFDNKLKNVFQKKCFDCHGSANAMPWYYSLPVVKGLMDHDIREAKEHLDMSHGYPFKVDGD